MQGSERFPQALESIVSSARMPVTICDVANYRLGREAVTGDDFMEARVPMLGGCEGCHASIACYNAYPSTSGYLRCEDCIGDDGYATVEEAVRAMFDGDKS